MKGKAGGSLAVGAVLAAMAYFSSGVPRTEQSPADSTSIPMTASSGAASPKTSPGVTLPDLRQPDSGDTVERSYDSVEVFYATDRAVVGAAPLIKRHLFGAMGVGLGISVLLLTGWLEWRGRRTMALVTVVSGTVVTAALMFLGPGLIGTTRGIHAPVTGGSPYGVGRGALQVGVCEVTIPKSHESGEVEKPSILRLEFSASPDRHVMLQRVIPQDEAKFYDGVRRRVQASPQRDLFVFVHGFNVSFESAARRTAQMAHDLHYAGAPIFYSWPSQGQPWEYTVDETNVVWSVPHLKQFLTDLARESDAKAINLIAHSMGSRALTQAVRELAYECKEDKKLFEQVILAAPDIDADVFREQIAPALARHSSKVTLYASTNDEALAASKLVHGSRRAGESAEEPLVVPGVETIDVAIDGLGLLGHSYYGSSPLILRDLDAILREARPAALRPWLAAFGEGGARYWMFQDPESSTAQRSDASTQLR